MVFAIKIFPSEKIRVEGNYSIEIANKSGVILYPTKNYSTFYNIPFGNCQIFVVGWFCHLLKFCKTKEDILKQVYEIQKCADNRKLMMIDVNINLVEEVEEVFKNKIHKKTPYTNTNGSRMCMFLINLSK